MSKAYVITIDGPAGAGKSSVAKSLAKRLGFSYLDTGAMYRALTLKALHTGIDLTDEDQLVVLARKTKIDFKESPDGLRVVLDGGDVSDDIRTLEVTNNTFYVARAGKVREVLVEWQRQIGASRSIVAEGRDVGTVVFPKADKKFFLDADVNERARRRIAELRDKGNDVDADCLLNEIKERDQKDRSRATGPLVQANDAVYIDSTHHSINDTVEAIMACLPETLRTYKR